MIRGFINPSISCFISVIGLELFMVEVVSAFVLISIFTLEIYLKILQWVDRTLAWF